MSEKRVKKYAGEVKEDPDCIKRASKARYASTGEPSKAPNLDDAVAERAATASNGSKSKKK